MSPAGHWPQLHAAIEAGADAVYFGLTHFTARAKVGFTLAELPAALRTLHRRGVKGYVTFNTLVYDEELPEALKGLEAIANAGADAIIVQDIGIAKLAHAMAPELHIHGSTQMSVTSAEGVNLAAEFGVRRVVLARELSLDDIRAIRAATATELEIFVHGALCVSYSGQCFSSEAWGGRSANRGQCAQACRLPYTMLVDGALRPLADARYLLSPGDLYALQQVPEIVAAGISSLKIEGRYKDADYVALTTAAYRKAVDEACAGLPVAITAAEEQTLAQVYSRTLGPHFLAGTNQQQVVEGRAPRHRGVEMGRVSRILGNAVLIEPTSAQKIAPLKPGDGVVFDAADWRSPEEHEEGGRLYEVISHGGRGIELRFANNVIDWARIRPGDKLWRTHDPAVDKLVRIYTEPAAPVRKQNVIIAVSAHEGAPLVAEWRVAGLAITVISADPLGRAQQRPLDAAYLRDQFGRLGNTPYQLADITLETSGSPFAPSSMLNQLRRDAVDQLQSAQQNVKAIAFTPQPITATRHTPASQPPVLHVLVRTADQLEAAIETRPASITLDYLDLYGLRPSVKRIQSAGIAARVASPRVLKPSEERIVHFLRKLDCEVLVRSAGLLHSFRQGDHPPLSGDFSLNAANAISAQTLLDLGIHRVTPTHDLNAGQISELARRIGPAFIETVAYQHLPVFHTEHCVFCRFLSTGTSYKDCGHPCEQHRVALRDVAGRAHPVMADVGCRNTVFGAEAQEASLHLEKWRAVGIHHFRLEFVHESPDRVSRITRLFHDALHGAVTYRELNEKLKRLSPEGITEGSLYIPKAELTVLT
ncbi:MAG: U32 family peptidase [Acidobacteria bacterium]|nr:U32 family peptidase [Acidobacteriota bacterium]